MPGIWINLAKPSECAPEFRVPQSSLSCLKALGCQMTSIAKVAITIYNLPSREKLYLYVLPREQQLLIPDKREENSHQKSLPGFDYGQSFQNFSDALFAKRKSAEYSC